MFLRATQTSVGVDDLIQFAALKNPTPCRRPFFVVFLELN